MYLPRPAYLRQPGGGGAGRGGGREGDGAVPRPRRPSHHLLPLGLQQLGQQREWKHKILRCVLSSCLASMAGHGVF